MLLGWFVDVVGILNGNYNDGGDNGNNNAGDLNGNLNTGGMNGNWNGGSGNGNGNTGGWNGNGNGQGNTGGGMNGKINFIDSCIIIQFIFTIVLNYQLFCMIHNIFEKSGY